MKLITKKLAEITPYENNPRRNDTAVAAYEIIILPVTTQVCKRVKAYEQLRLQRTTMEA